MRTTLISLSLFSLVALGCTPGADSDITSDAGSAKVPVALSSDDMTAHSELTAKVEQAFLEGDMELMASCYAEDAVLMGPNEPVIEGREAIIGMFSNFPPMKSVTITDIEVEGFGDYAYVRGTVSMTMEIPGVGEITEIGKILEIRERQSDGTWLITRDMYNSDMPLEGATE